MYFLIYNSDGDTHVVPMTRQQLLARLNDGEFGNGFMAKVQDTDTGLWSDRCLLIKGEIVTPKPVQTVTEYAID